MTPDILGLRFAATISFFLLLAFDFGHGEPLYGNIATENLSGRIAVTGTKNFTPIHKALLTQRGYIQFLRWELPVPEIQEFTFCLWVKSINLTYPHSIFSYSKNEKDRLIRSWISSFGRSIHLEINNVEIFAQRTDIREHRWYHICESWDNEDGRYAMWINGQKIINGYAQKTAGHVIPSKGDIVLGQEYTDFDKGLEEGIEGAVLGFNLILKSAFESRSPFFERNRLEDVGFTTKTDSIGYEATVPSIYGTRTYPRVVFDHPVFDKIPLTALGRNEPRLTGYEPLTIAPTIFRTRRVSTRDTTRTKRKFNFYDDGGVNNPIERRYREKPLGQQLVEISFRHCEKGRGSPNIGGELMLISWTRTPVRVFGGAIIKNAKNVCGNF